MRDRSNMREAGFSLLEMVIAMALGTIVLGGAVQMYTQGVAATWATTQRAELQQDFRAGSNMLTKDLSLAAAGLNPGTAIALPSGSSPVYGCSQATVSTPQACYLGAGNSSSVPFPTQGATAYFYGLLPGYDHGPTLLAAQGPTDVVTVAYTDNTFYLDCYSASITTGTTVTFTPIVPTPPATSSANCTAPGGNSAAQAVNDSAVGLTTGDLVLFTFGSTNLLAEVTTSANAGGVATFATGDALNLNQASGVANSLAYQFAHGTTTGYGQRLQLITYYINNAITPPRLMQQVSGHIPVPVAENVVYMKFTYDLFNDATNQPAVACSNPGAASDGCSNASAGLLPNQITKINIQNMAMDSTLSGSQFGLKNGYQRMDLQTSVCARNLTYVNNYPN